MVEQPQPLTSRIVQVFLQGHLTPLLILLSLLAGAIALFVTPREEEPQIVVPVADIVVQVPGSSAAEVERIVSTRLEQLLMEIDGVEYVYSVSQPDRAMVTVRFFVGEDREDSLVKLHNKLQMNVDRIPPQVSAWVVKPIEVDDVPILAFSIYSDRYDDFALRRMAEELERQVQMVPDTGRTEVLGGRSRLVRVQIDPEALAARELGPEQLIAALRGATQGTRQTSIVRQHEIAVATAAFDVVDLEALVVGVHSGSPVRLRDVATVLDGPAEPVSYSRISFGPAAGDDVDAALRGTEQDFDAVTLTVAKRKGSNAVWVSQAVQARVEALCAEQLPDDVFVRVTRDYGATAHHKVNELVEALLVAVLMVIALLAMILGWREAIIVATAVPLTFGLTLLVNYLSGYSINRVTMFALILALGLVVDDPIVDVENIHRHLRRGKESPFRAVLNAVNEVRPPIILATLAVMVSFLPMFFITGMMGPYMAPMALNVPLAMLMSLVVAFTVTPWISLLMLRRGAAKYVGTDSTEEADHTGRIYSAILRPLLRSRAWRLGALGVTAALFVFSGYLALARQVPLKMLPFDNKDELQVVIDMPEGTPLELTESVAAEMAAELRRFAEVVDVSSFVGIASPMDFNGMVRQYYARRASHLADLRVNLLGKKQRASQSHAIGIRFRQALVDIARRRGARIQVVESPPGPPVSATLTAELYGAEHTSYAGLQAAATTLAARLEREAGVVDLDTTVPASQRRLVFVIDRDKAALHGLREADVSKLLQMATDGTVVATLHTEREANPLGIELRLPLARRSSADDLLQLPVAAAGGASVMLSEVGRFEERVVDSPIYRKNMRRVAYVFADIAGRAPADVILDVQADQVHGDEVVSAAEIRSVDERSFLANGAGIPWRLEEGIELSFHGEGEWKITLDAFRDLGLAFFAACFGIYLLLVHETKSYLMPLILMLAIPFTIIGIMPGFWLLNLVAGGEVGGVATPVFFTATGMIGMIALAGIAVRNSILLIEFVRRAEQAGHSVRDAILQAGAARFRPILLTAGTAMLAALPITIDPIFSGLAWALIFGLLVSSGFTLVLVPMVYFMVYGAEHGRKGRGEG